MEIGKWLILSQLLLCSCESEEKIRTIHGHTYLKGSWGHYHHDELCPECQKNAQKLNWTKQNGSDEPNHQR